MEKDVELVLVEVDNGAQYVAEYEMTTMTIDRESLLVLRILWYKEPQNTGWNEAPIPWWLSIPTDRAEIFPLMTEGTKKTLPPGFFLQP